MPRRAAYGLNSPEVAAWYREMAFASACSMRIASLAEWSADAIEGVFASACSMRIASQSVHHRIKSRVLCLSVLYADCIGSGRWAFGRLCTLPQRAPCGLHQQAPAGAIRGLSLPQRAPCGLHSKNARMSIRYAAEYAVSR